MAEQTSEAASVVVVLFIWWDMVVKSQLSLPRGKEVYGEEAKRAPAGVASSLDI